MPQIEVTFDIDANGILNVSAKDKGTGKEQKIRIEASSGLTEEEIQRMRDEAKANEAKDKEEKERIDKINAADSNIFATEKQLKEYGDKLPADKKSAIEAALGKLKEAHKNADVMAIDTAITELNAAWQAASQDIYAQQQAQGGANANANAGAGASGAGAARRRRVRGGQVTGRRQRAAGFGLVSEPCVFYAPCEPASLPAAVCLVGCFWIVRLKCRSGGQTQSRSPLSPRSVSEREGSGNLRRFAPCGPHPPPAADCRTTIRRSPSDKLRPILASDAFRASSSGWRCRNWYSGGPATECC